MPPQVSYEQVNLMLRLYDIRREPRLRQARAWFVEHFHPVSPEEMMQKYPQGGEENTYIRMVISYWDMVASIVNRGLIDDELFFESNGEIWVVWDRMHSIVPTWRAAFNTNTRIAEERLASPRSTSIEAIRLAIDCPRTSAIVA